MSADFDKLREIFLEAVEQHPPRDWEVYLDQACSGNEELRRGAAALLKAHEEGDSLVDDAVAGDRTASYSPISEGPGAVIGHYKLLEQIGEGGFGVVFMAEQQQPIRRKVALKVLKPGMDTRQVIARFEAERQALALMDHPNIAKVLDAGQTDSGRPYFVMDLVKGVPITEFCDQGQLTLKERLELFVPVCHAVQHAHQKGIIHRDIKPSNVLVTLHDGTPVPKIIDFGIAKALGQQLTDKTLYTGFAQMIGTPLYMSPEQAALSNVDVDTRSDIYSLGVLLYELLTGTTPFDKERLNNADYDELRRIIREEEPPKPSTRISTLAQAATTISGQRKSDPKQLSRLFRGELDWIVMKALEKDRNRRYETASAFAADVQRYLHDEPVQACPPSAWYQFRKLARKHKVGLVIAVCVFLVLAVLAGSIGWYVRDRSVRNAVNAHNNLGAALAGKGRLDDAIGEYRRAIEIDPTDINPHNNLALALSDKGQLDDAVREHRTAIDLDPKRAVLHYNLGVTVAHFGQWDKATAAFAAALDLDPSNPLWWYQSATLHLQIGDLAGYRRACDEMLARFGQSEAPAVADWTAKTCLLAPDAVRELESVLKFVDSLVEMDNWPYFRWVQLTKGLAEYRGARYASAIDWLKRYDPKGDRPRSDLTGHHSDAIVFAVLAMAHHRLGATEEAREALSQARSILGDKKPRPEKGERFGRDWHDWLHAQILCCEAETLIGTGDRNGPHTDTQNAKKKP